MRTMRKLVEEKTTLYEATLEFQAAYLQAVLDECLGSAAEAAHMVGVHRNTLHRHLAECRLLDWVESSRRVWRKERSEVRREVTQAFREDKTLTPRQRLAQLAVLSLPNLLKTYSEGG